MISKLVCLFSKFISLLVSSVPVQFSYLRVHDVLSYLLSYLIM